MLNVSEVLTILEKEGLTSSRQVVLRWIRHGDLPAVQESRKIGYQIEQSDLDEFIAKKKYTPLRLKFFSDYCGFDRAFLSR